MTGPTYTINILNPGVVFGTGCVNTTTYFYEGVLENIGPNDTLTWHVICENDTIHSEIWNNYDFDNSFGPVPSEPDSVPIFSYSFDSCSGGCDPTGQYEIAVHLKTIHCSNIDYFGKRI